MTATMTTTPFALESDCPRWCTQHDWFSPSADLAQHRAPVLMSYPACVEHPSKRSFEVSPERFVHDDGLVENLVYIHDMADGTLLSAAEVGELVEALTRASRSAFGDPQAEARAELDAALAEVVARAEHPQDINRLVAAAVRLRNAHRALAGQP